MRSAVVLGLLTTLTLACDHTDLTDRRDAATARDAATPDDAARPSDADADAGAPADARPDSGAQSLSLGVLQFRVTHNLVDDTCLTRGPCHLELEATPAQLPSWLTALDGASTQAVLHVDRALPWLAFAQDPPAGVDPQAYYTARLDPELRAYLAAFRAHFGHYQERYLALSILDGTRDRIAPLRRADGTTAPTPERCTTLTATTTLDFGDGARVQIWPAYRRLVRYLARELGPTRLALMVEINLYERTCPDAWPGVVALYHELYTTMRAELGPEVQLFATLTAADLLGYDSAACNPPVFGLCGGDIPAAPPPDTARCFPLHRAPLDDLARDDHLDVLALSFYPDGLSMQPPGVPTSDLVAFPAASDGHGPCYARAHRAALVDPLVALERLAWTKPMAIAEWSARSCPTYAWWAAPDQTVLVRYDSTPEEQAYWLDRLVTLARDGRLAFVNQSFLMDYPPIAPWMARTGAMDGWLYTLLNGWACSGLATPELAPKPGVRERWPR